MQKIDNGELMNIVGGNISGAVINAFNTFVKTIYNLGQSFGSSLRRMISHKVCDCN